MKCRTYKVRMNFSFDMTVPANFTEDEVYAQAVEFAMDEINEDGITDLECTDEFDTDEDDL